MPERALAGLADDREALEHQVLEALAVASPLAQALDPLAQLGVGLELELLLEQVDPPDALLIRLELLGFAHAKRAVQEGHGASVAMGPGPLSGPQRRQAAERRPAEVLRGRNHLALTRPPRPSPSDRRHSDSILRRRHGTRSRRRRRFSRLRLTCRESSSLIRLIECTMSGEAACAERRALQMQCRLGHLESAIAGLRSSSTSTSSSASSDTCAPPCEIVSLRADGAPRRRANCGP